jgi:octanoyl-[GcvH]:protein N-octanoyltransferase
MRVVRGTIPDIERDRAVTRRLAEAVEATGRPAVRVWTPPRQVAFGRRDAAADGYQRAREAALQHGYEPIERSVGGRAVAYTGETVAFNHAVSVDDGRGGIGDRYDAATDRLESALESVGADVEAGEPEDSFCPGEHSLQSAGKIAGIAQRVRSNSAVVGGCVVATRRDERALATVLEPVYAALGVPFDPASVGSVEAAGGPGDTRRVVDAIESAVLDGREREVVDAAELLPE